MRRHSALFRLRPGTSAEQLEAMLRGLAYLGMECGAVAAGDYGEELLRRVGRGGHDVALHVDFADGAAYDAYVADPLHRAVSSFNASLSLEGATARVDWDYDGPPPNRRGAVRHCALHRWRPQASAQARADALAAARGLASAAGVSGLVVAEDVGVDPRAADWVLDVTLAGAGEARALLEGPAYAEAAAAVAAATIAAERASVTHRVRGSGR